MILLTTGEIRKLTGVPSTTFDNWVVRGIVQPVVESTGTGDHRKWSFMQAVGFVIAEHVRQSELSCALKFVGATVAAFGSVDEAWLNKRLARGERYYVHPHRGTPLLRKESEWAWADAAEAYEKVANYVAKKQQPVTTSK